MRTLVLTLVAGVMGGCGAFVTFYPDGRIETAEITCAKDVQVLKYDTDGHGHRTIDGGVSHSNEKITAAVVEGAVTAVLKTINPFGK